MFKEYHSKYNLLLSWKTRAEDESMTSGRFIVIIIWKEMTTFCWQRWPLKTLTIEINGLLLSNGIYLSKEEGHVSLNWPEANGLNVVCVYTLKLRDLLLSLSTACRLPA